MSAKLPTLTLTDWRMTRDTLHLYARIIGKIRSHYMPKSKHWWHITLYVTSRGLTTSPFPVAGQNLELSLDLVNHQLKIDSSEGWSTGLSLVNQSSAEFCNRISSYFTAKEIDLPTALFNDFQDKHSLAYDTQAVDRFRKTINWVDTAFKTFKGGLREETAPVQLFPHHMDLSMNWFSGRLVPDSDPADEESADEQMNFGFVTGDSSIPDAYFYVTAYPTPDNWSDLTLPQGAYWYTEGWTGAILPYAALTASDQPQEILLNYFQQLQSHGKKLMS